MERQRGEEKRVQRGAEWKKDRHRQFVPRFNGTLTDYRERVRDWRQRKGKISTVQAVLTDTMSRHMAFNVHGHGRHRAPARGANRAKQHDQMQGIEGWRRHPDRPRPWHRRRPRQPWSSASLLLPEPHRRSRLSCPRRPHHHRWHPPRHFLLVSLALRVHALRQHRMSWGQEP